MMNARTLLARVAACTLLAGGTFALAGETSSQPALSSELSLQPKYMADAAPAAPARKPLMGLLDKAGVAKPLDDMGINIYGLVEGSYTKDFQNAPNSVIPGRVFDFKDNQALLNQIDLTIERTVDLKKFDIGGKAELIYGSDAGGIHANGLFDYYNESRGYGKVSFASKNSPENQLDLVQAYVDIAIPVGNGIDLKLGKFVTQLGQETINPTTNALFSHSYLFGYAIPFTHTGALASYSINDNWSVYAGFSRGWEQCLDDNNESIDVLFGGKFVTTDKKLAIILNVVTGPEQPKNNTDDRTVIDVVASYAVTDKLSFAVNGDYGWEDVGGSIVDWYGVAAYASYVLCNEATLNARAEWFRDNDGTRLGVVTDIYEFTLGVAIKPFAKDDLGSNLVIRPEVRYDTSTAGILGDGTNKDMFTFGVDAIFTF